MTLKATSVRLDDETLAGITQIAEALDRPRAWLMAQASKQYVERETWFIKEVAKGSEEAKQGK